MYTIVKNVITTGSYELVDMLKKIDTLWVQGSLTDEQRAELVQFAQEKANAANSIDVMAKLQEHDRRIEELAQEVAALKNAGSEDEGEADSEAGGEQVEEFPEYVAGTWYYAGNIVNFEGEAHICVAPEGQVCTWSPAEYPAYWQKYTAAEEAAAE